MRIGQLMQLSELELWQLFYTVMMKDLGCSSNAARICELYLSDDIVFKRDYKSVSSSLPKVLGFVFSHTGPQTGLAERFKTILSILRNGGAIANSLIETRCQRGAEIAARLRFPPPVCDGIRSLDEHWNGGGRPPPQARAHKPPNPPDAILAQSVAVVQ